LFCTDQLTSPRGRFLMGLIETVHARKSLKQGLRHGQVQLMGKLAVSPVGAVVAIRIVLGEIRSCHLGEKL